MTENVKDLYVNCETGEVLRCPQGSTIITPEQKERNKNYFKMVEEAKMRIERVKEGNKKYGTFIWNFFELSQPLIEKVKPSTITRVMFLATYLGYDGYLVKDRKTKVGEKVLSTGHIRDANAKQPLTDKDIFTLLKLSKGEFSKFVKEVQENEIMFFNNGKWYMNSKQFTRGTLDTQQVAIAFQNDYAITRLYIAGVRALYNSATTRSHKTLSYIFKILPYVNLDYNIVCFNPKEPSLDDIKCMTLGDFCSIIEYDPHNISRLYKALFEPQFLIKGELKSAIGYVSSRNDGKGAYRIFINPIVYYAGNQWDKVEVLGKF